MELIKICVNIKQHTLDICERRTHKIHFTLGFTHKIDFYYLFIYRLSSVFTGNKIVFL